MPYLHIEPAVNRCRRYIFSAEPFFLPIFDLQLAYICNVLQGFNVGIFSPTLPDIERLTSSSTTDVSMTLIWCGLASVLGTLAIGPLFDRLDWFALLGTCVVLQGLFVGLAPISTSLAVYQIFAALGFVFNFALMSGM